MGFDQDSRRHSAENKKEACADNGWGVGGEISKYDWQAELIREDIQGALQNYRSGRGERRAAALR